MQHRPLTRLNIMQGNPGSFNKIKKNCLYRNALTYCIVCIYIIALARLNLTEDKPDHFNKTKTPVFTKTH